MPMHTTFWETKQTKYQRQNLKGDHMKMMRRVLILAVLAVVAVGRSHAQLGVTHLQPPPLPPLPPPLALPLVQSWATPDSGTYYSVQLTNQPPLPFNPIRALGVPVYSIGSNLFLIDDSTVNYAALAEHEQQLRELRAMAVTFGLENQFVEEYGAEAGLPLPQNAGGPMESFFFTSSDLWLEITNVWPDSTASLVIHPPVTILNGVWDIFATTNLNRVVSGLNGTNWAWLLRTVPGQTNIVVPMLSPIECYYRAAGTNDSDFDGFTDAYELWVGHTDPNVPDVIVPPVIQSQPLSQTVVPGDTVTFSVTAGGSAPLNYQWSLDGNPIAGATKSSLTLENIQHRTPSTEGEYSVLVSNPAGTIVSSNAQLTLVGSGDPYITLIGPRQDYLFRGDTTYVVSSPVELFGTTTIEGGAIIKFDGLTNSTLRVKGPLFCKTEAYHPAILTSFDDDSLGQVINGSFGLPEATTNGEAYLDLDSAGGDTISNLRFCFADNAVTTPIASRRLDVWNCQFVQCVSGLANHNTGAASRNELHNVLFADCGVAVAAYGTGYSISAEQVTADVGTFWYGTSAPTRIGVTNSIIFGTLTGSGSLFTSSIAVNPSVTNFQIADLGGYYLTEGSSLRHAGSMNISTNLLSLLRQRTTQPPLAFKPYMTLSGSMTLAPQPGRYTNGAPDLGYHYDAMDYSVATMILMGGSLEILQGTVIGLRNEYITNSGGWTIAGFWLTQGSTLVSKGTALAPNTLTLTKYVQEYPSAFVPSFYGLPFGNIALIPGFEPNAEGLPAPTMLFQSSRFFIPSEDYVLWSGLSEDQNWITSPDSAVYWMLRDSSVHGGRINLGAPDYFTFGTDYYFTEGHVSWFNNLFDRVTISLNPTFYWLNQVANVDQPFEARNNLFRSGGWFLLEPCPSSGGDWLLEDNLFDKVDFLQDVNQALNHDHNGYSMLGTNELAWGGPYEFARLAPTITGNGTTNALHDVVLGSAPPYQAGSLGSFYLPNSTALFGAGSRTPDEAGLYHYTTRLDQVKEGSEPGAHQVNIGLHYVATANGVAKDNDSDGIPDVVEDANGNGLADGNETSAYLVSTDGMTNDPYNTAYDDVDLSGSGLVGRIKRALGIAPLDSVNPLTLTQVTTGDEADVAMYSVGIPFELVGHDSTNNLGTVKMVLDGQPLSAWCGSNSNGTCLFSWDTRFNPPGPHILQAKLNLNLRLSAGPEPDPTIITAVGIPAYHISTNEVQLDSFYNQFNDAHGAVIFAKLATNTATYSIELRSSDGSHVKWLSTNETTTTGEIEVPWDLTDDNGQPYTNASFKAAISFPQSPRTTVFDLYKFLFPPDDGNFTIAYAGDSSADIPSLRQAIQWTVVDQLIGICNATFCYNDVYQSTFNTWSALGTIPGNPGHLATQTNADLLLTNLSNVNGPAIPTKNFFFFGHGGGTIIGTKNSDARLSSRDVAYALGNQLFAFGGGTNHVEPGVLCLGQKYRLVFLDGCATANSPEWAFAFGIRKKITQRHLAHMPEAAQAYIGWEGLKKIPTSSHFFDIANCYSVFWSAWQSGLPLDRCVFYASQDHPPAPISFIDLSDYNLGPRYQHWGAFDRWKHGITADPRIRIFGYPGITRTGFQPGYDNSAYQK